MRAAIVAIAALLAWGCAARPEGARLSAARERALAAYAAAASAYDSGRLEQAEGLAESSLEAEATFLPSLTLLGKAAYLAGDDAGAERALRKAVRASPRAGEAALWLARTYRATGRPGLAMSACETILSSDPSSVAALRLAATLSTDSGDRAAAVAYLDAAIEAAAEAGLAFADRAALRWAAGDAEGAAADLASAMANLPPESAPYAAASAMRDEVMGRRR